jgi:bifunctional N-acetylglucosamine-1-phosphate-uridyltransferase/glucosamine-1-phosphate-acetyltransferase GlmU-like protein
MNCFIVLAGGFGKRMKSPIPKVLHKIADVPMIVKLIKQIPLVSDQPYDIIVVVNTKTLDAIRECLMKYIDKKEFDRINFCIQVCPRGTGHALQCCFVKLKDYKYDTKVVVLQGDCPLIKAETIGSMLEFKYIKIMIMEHIIPNSYGRIVREMNGKIRIVESRDCDEKQKSITKVNCGVYSYSLEYLMKYLFCLSNDNSQNEYYITDLVELIQSGFSFPVVEVYELPSSKKFELTNINDQETLKLVNDMEKVYDLKKK